MIVVLQTQATDKNKCTHDYNINIRMHLCCMARVMCNYKQFNNHLISIKIKQDKMIGNVVEPGGTFP